ncbi:isochorismate synthase DhbC [Bacillus paralicheniformis]|uniref:isochorismate synthase DhbC n=1 Tax=Bacillus paralicheniformis TaxID=1648923 RepID=UPI000501DC13|nr:isochorismate synthase DhbC [Bacillus paralicheniformis]KFM84647.1 isochorismate synthase dhbC [Bacillus paralicheniformis]MEC2169325.1 isochorismate synthase DhbC [Bacillus paralicheniformis]WOH93492.1 isochorismate synthase DhbC [Bacillus paralicheniformis]
MIERHVVSEALADQLLKEYQAGASFFFSSPERTILAEGVLASVSQTEEQSLAQRAAEVLKKARENGQKNPMVVGAVPFDDAKPAQLTVPVEAWQAGPLTCEEDGKEEPEPALYLYDIEQIPSPEAYMTGVRRGLAGIAAGEYSKIVLSRSLQLTSPIKVDIGQLLRNLARRNTSGYNFAVDLTGQSPEAPRTTLIGASPELLVSRSGFRVTANPLAGSRPRSDDPEEDRRRAAELLASPKDRHEHAVVVEAVASALKPFCRKLEVPEPSLISTPTMWHLSTELKGELTDLSVSSLELAAALHPTPAVCGTPTNAAKEAIKQIEPFDRGFFTGMVGWCDADGDGEWVVTIRCAEAEEHALRLYAGAGIVAGSKPEEELAETSAKFRTMLLAMGMNSE